MRFFLGLMLFLYCKTQSKNLNFGKNCSVPDASVEILQWLAAPWSLLRGLCWNHRFHAPSARSRPMSVMRGLCWNHWFRPSCACVLAALPCRTGGAHRTLWFLLSKKTWPLSTKKWFKFKCNGPQNFLSFTLRWFTLYEFLAEAPGPEKTNKILAEAPGPEKTDKILMKHVNSQ